MPGQIREPGRTVTSRVLAVLDAFRPEDTDLSLADLCRRTGMASSTAHRLVAELVTWGGLERTGDRYRIGLRLFEIGMLAPGRRSLTEVALPFLEDLYAVTHENVHLAIRDGRHAVYLHKITGQRSVDAPSRSGGRLPLHATAMGKAMLAFGPPELAEEAIAAGLTRHTAHTITSPGLLRHALAQVRERGFAVAAQEYSLGTVSVAAPVPASDGSAIAAVSVVVRSSRANVARLGPAVRTTAKAVARDQESFGRR